MTVYVYDHATGKVVEKGEETRSLPKGPYIMGDLPGYKSPLGTGWIEGRRARREDLARGGCREVDPSERLNQPRKTESDAAKERAYLAQRQASPFQMSPQMRERLLRGR